MVCSTIGTNRLLVPVKSWDVAGEDFELKKKPASNLNHCQLFISILTSHHLWVNSHENSNFGFVA